MVIVLIASLLIMSSIILFIKKDFSCTSPKTKNDYVGMDNLILK